jgi:hypothetical protein
MKPGFRLAVRIAGDASNFNSIQLKGVSLDPAIGCAPAFPDGFSPDHGAQGGFSRGSRPSSVGRFDYT